MRGCKIYYLGKISEEINAINYIKNMHLNGKVSCHLRWQGIWQ